MQETSPEIMELARAVAMFVATHSHCESVFATPDPRWLMSDPVGLLDILKNTAGISSEQIDAWCVEAQANA